MAEGCLAPLTCALVRPTLLPEVRFHAQQLILQLPRLGAGWCARVASSCLQRALVGAAEEQRGGREGERVRSSICADSGAAP